MKILILNWRDIKHPLSGGAEISLNEHAQYWKKKGAKIIWFSSQFKGCKNEEILDGIVYVRKGNYYTGFIWVFIYFLFGKFKDTDIIVDCFHFIPYFTPLYLLRKKKVAFIHEVAGRIWFKNLSYPLALFGYFIEPFIIRLYKSTPFITVSNSTKNSLVQHGIHAKNITVINNGVSIPQNVKRFKKQEAPTLIFLARISNDKGIEDALTAVSILQKDFKNIKIWIIGKVESQKYLEKIEKNIKELGLFKNCKLFGYIDENKKFELLSRAWILIHPSIREGWGLTVIEAASQETPTVGYDVEGLRDSIINNRTGILSEKNAKSLALNVEELLNDKDKLKKMSVLAQKWSENFSWVKSGVESWHILIKLLENKS